VTADQRFRPQDRIRRRSEYQVSYTRGRRIPSRNFVLFVAPNALGRPRLGLTMTRRLGGAVRRNRAKRLLREIFRRHKAELADVDVVVNGRAGLPGANYRQIEEEFLACLKAYRKSRD
jgi:ribonuclease P protein component